MGAVPPTDNAPRKFSPKDIGARFKKARKATKLTQEQLEAVGVPQSSLSRFETGKRGVETDSLLAAFCAVAEAGGNIDYVLRGVGEPLRSKVEIIATSPELAEQLRALQRRLETPSDLSGSTHQAPRTRDKGR